MTYKSDLVSIITPSYNTAKFIEQTINSVLQQTYTNWELLIVDDCSNDNTDSIIAKYSDPRIHYFKNVVNKGAAYSRNFALKKAEGEWIAFLDSDDLWKKDKLIKQLSFMKGNCYYFSCTSCSKIDEDNNPLGIRVKSPKHITKQGMFLYCWPSCLTVMYHFPTVGLIQIDDLKKNNDYALWLHAIKKTDCYFLNEDLAYYRKRKGSISNDKFKRLIKAHFDLYQKDQKMGSLTSFCLTGVNLIFGFGKKVFYEKKII